MFASLNSHNKIITSQDGEDGIIEFLVNNFNINKTLIEVGSHDGMWLSNTFNLWHNKKFKSLLIEYDYSCFNKLVKNFSSHKNILCLRNKIHFNDEQIEKEKLRDSTESDLWTTLDAVAQNNNFQSNVGLLSIDATMLNAKPHAFSYDYHILKYLNYLKPHIIVIGFAYHIPGHGEFIESEECSFHLLGSSFKSTYNLAKKKNYQVVAATTNNIIMVNEAISKKFISLPAEEYFIWGKDNPKTKIKSNFFPIANPHTVAAIYQKNLNLSGKFLAKTIRYKLKLNYNKKNYVPLRKVPNHYINHCSQYDIYPI